MQPQVNVPEETVDAISQMEQKMDKMTPETEIKGEVSETVVAATPTKPAPVKQEVVTIYGKGEYALTSKNIEKLTTQLVTFNSTREWKWGLVDVLGVKKDGSKAKRFEQVITSLDETNPAQAALKTAMSNVTEQNIG